MQQSKHLYYRLYYSCEESLRKPGRPQQTAEADGFLVGHNSGRSPNITTEIGFFVSDGHPHDTNQEAGFPVSDG